MEEDIDIEGDDEEEILAQQVGELGDRNGLSGPHEPETQKQISVRSGGGLKTEDVTTLLEQYPEPGWLSEQMDWKRSLDADMDEQSRALIESMIAEEEFYFGQGTVSLPPSGDRLVKSDSKFQQDDKKIAKKRTSGGPDDGLRKKTKRDKLSAGASVPSHKVKWTKEEDERLREGIRLYGYGSWKRVASFMKTRTALQIKNHVRHLTVHGGVRFEGSGAENCKGDLAVDIPAVDKKVDMQEEDEDVDIDITDDEDPIGKGENGGTTLAENVVLVPGEESAENVENLGITEEREAVESGDDESSGTGENVTLATREDVGLASDISSSEAANRGQEKENNLPPASCLEESFEGEQTVTDMESLREVAEAGTHGTESLQMTENDGHPCVSATDVSLESSSVEAPGRTSSASDLHELGTRPVKMNISTSESRSNGANTTSGHSEELDESPLVKYSEKASEVSEDSGAVTPLDLSAVTRLLIPDDLETTSSAAEESTSFEIDSDAIQRFEVSSLPEWFLSTLAVSQGKKPHPRTLHKTPERYKKIRNYILAAWDKCKPKYLTKTSVRPGLKGEGDVNAIGRIHEFLENIGAINVGCAEKGGRKYYGGTGVKKPKEDLADDMTELEAGSVWSFMEEGRRRRRRVRNERGEWVYEDTLGGDDDEGGSAQTGEDLAIAKEEARLFALNSKYFADEELEKYDKRLLKRRQRQRGFAPSMGAPDSDILGDYDPFRLIPTRSYSTDVPAPFRVVVQSNAMIVMDVHSHLAHTEIIGLLGGTYDPIERILKVADVFPCRSLSTGVQCEMDPDSEMQAREVFSAKGYDVVGWYHSHPTFDPIPSIRDIENQIAYQTLFQRHDGVEPFIGAIVTPYDPRYSADRRSRFGLLSVSQEWNSMHEYRLPYSCNVTVVASETLSGELFEQLTRLLKEYRNYEQ
ncbi:uncharacterized protein SPPG_00695 [Spizellomyces punctatus DAOM BR117]|uniref:Uncharacterized protein n=1 Tax=Spizellomyces punctatus (strain DAOM BR117) TaxID=645134 RepID=A0A0L0HVV8_SPIPD|nr:uncharacterized protein SPPG_00695 [Spizellomyces punctatus DAOM BR117]KND05014.1 hypothetical protein SPPG_00695 [Spizellomyces punctatus DAOM BR117]|eukprot:XP_016613053.1 hypothetical protein SPPG_00695 [Spizellomyces punctatus DAOM BR117]